MLLLRLLTQGHDPTDPEGARRLLILSQWAFGILSVGALFWIRNRERPSGFRVRESDRMKRTRIRLTPAGEGKPQLSGPQPGPAAGTDELARAKMKRKQPRLLGGFVADGKPHEILGVKPNATEAEIQKAYRDLMKRYHPDIVGRPGSREWTDAQKLAEAINRAKEELIASARACRGKGAR